MLPKYAGKSVGLAKVMAELPYSDGSTASEIVGFRVDERGVLDSTFRLMPLIPDEWRGASQPAALQAGVLAMCCVIFYGETPEILLLTLAGVFRYAPWDRAAGGANPGLTEQLYYDADNTTSSVVPQGQTRYPPQIEAIGNRVYFTFCDGGGAWVWDGSRLRPFGYTGRPSPPAAEGPQRDEDGNPLGAGFSVAGRVGDLEPGWINADAEPVGGLQVFRREYYYVWENTDGAYSATSDRGGSVTMNFTLAAPDDTPPTYLEQLRRRFRSFNFPGGPPGTAAGILLCTRNLERLPAGDDGSPRFLHRFPSDLVEEWVDDIPDGELGAAWLERDATPVGFYFLRHFGGSMWLLRTDGEPAGVWWTEQENLVGPTPESILRGHHRQVSPITGAITGAAAVRLGGAQGNTSALLVFKEQAVHIVTGTYPRWEFGTAHERAGMEGPNLFQVAPDGVGRWYGNRTLWHILPTGQVQDIGDPVRRRLKRVNHAFAHMGQSYVDEAAGEVVFILPLDDATVPNWQFCYDYRGQGWRLRNDVRTTAVLSLPGVDLLLVAGRYNNVTTLWAYGRGYPGYTVPPPTWVYSTGWTGFAPFGPDMHASFGLREVVFLLEERGEDAIIVKSWRNWNEDVSSATSHGVVHTAHPDDDALAFLIPDATLPAEYGESLWRTRRIYNERVAIGEDSVTVFRVSISGKAPIGIVSIEAYGPRLAGPGSRNPEGDD